MSLCHFRWAALLSVCVALHFAKSVHGGVVFTEWPVAKGGNGHEYAVVSVPGGITWPQANEQALMLGGHLATITSQAENDFVFQLVDDFQFWRFEFDRGFGPWLGGFQPPGSPEPAGNWQWVTGEPFDFVNWSSREPSNNSGNLQPEDRLHFFSERPATAPAPTWNDTAAEDLSLAPFAYVVERARPVPEPSSSLWALVAVGMSCVRKRR